MMIDKSITAVLLTLFFVITAPLLLYFSGEQKPLLAPHEQDLLKFSSQPLSLSPPKTGQIFTGRTSPVASAQKEIVRSNAKETAVTPVAGNSTTTAQSGAKSAGKSDTETRSASLSGLPVVSMISYDGNSRSAIVNDQLVREGSSFEGGTIVKIEERRLLLRRGGKNIWLTME